MAWGLPYVVQGLSFAAQGLHMAAQGLHMASQGLHLAAQGLHLAALWLHRGCIWLHRGCIWLHRGCMWLHRDCIWLLFGCTGAAYGCTGVAFSCTGTAYGCTGAAYGCIGAADAPYCTGWDPRILRPRSGGGNGATPGGLQATKPDGCRTPNINVTVYPACKLQYTCRQISQMVILRDLKDFRISNVHVAKDMLLSLVALKGPADNLH